MPHSIYPIVVKGITKTTPPKVIRGKLDVLDLIIEKHGVTENSGLFVENIMQFVIPNLTHSNPNIRETSLRIATRMSALYNEEIDPYLTEVNPHQVQIIKSGDPPKMTKSGSRESKKGVKASKAKTERAPSSKFKWLDLCSERSQGNKR
jgi:hypothetical protein